jgi:hypothetical protein
MTSGQDLGPTADGGVCAPGALRPAARKDFDAVLVPGTAKVLVYAGDEAPFSMALPLPRQFVDEFWQYDLAGCAWQTVSATNSPGARGAYAAAFDTKRNRMLIVAGRKGTDTAPPLTNEVWAFDVATNAWTQLNPGGTAPQPRVGHQVGYDPDKDRLFMIGGENSTGFGNAVLDEAWQLSFAASADGAWSRLSSSGGPGVRRDFALAYDSTHKWMVLFGGAVDFVTYKADLWIYDLSADAWQAVNAKGALPDNRFAAKLVFDAPRARYIMFGGHDDTALGLRNDTWAVTVDGSGAAAWTQLLAGDSDKSVGNVELISPERRDKNGFVLYGDTIWSFGGTSDCGPMDDTWVLDLKSPTAWTTPYPALVGETCYRRAMPGQSCASDCSKPL